MLALGRSSVRMTAPLVKSTVAPLPASLVTVSVQFQDPPGRVWPPTSFVLDTVRSGSALTCCVTGGDVLALNEGSDSYVATRLCVPALVIVMEQEPVAAA